MYVDAGKHLIQDASPQGLKLDPTVLLCVASSESRDKQRLCYYICLNIVAFG